MIGNRRDSENRLVVVLGGAGFIGSHLCRELVARGYKVRILSRIGSSHHLVSDIGDKVEIVEGDILSPYDVLDAIGDAETLLHLVHTTVPGSSMIEPEYDITNNVVGSVRWLTQLSKTNIRRLFYFSSGGTVYGVPVKIPIDESHPTNPICSYGVTKLAIEKYMALYSSQLDIDCYILRPSNVYGPGQQLHKGQGVIGVLADRVLREEPIDVFGTGMSQRDYLYIEDLVSAVMALLDYQGQQRVFNISCERGHSVNDIIQILQQQLGHIRRITPRPERGFDVPINVLSSLRLRTETEWESAIKLEDGIARTINWLRLGAPAAIEFLESINS